MWGTCRGAITAAARTNTSHRRAGPPLLHRARSCTIGNNSRSTPASTVDDDRGNNGNVAAAAAIRPIPKFFLPPAEPDLGYLLDPANRAEIAANVKARKAEDGVGVIDLAGMTKEEAAKIPNRTHPDAPRDEPTVIRSTEWTPQPGMESCPPRPFEKVALITRGLRTRDLGSFCGDKSYFLSGQLAELEQALISYTLEELDRLGFELVSVPDILHPDVVEACGMKVEGKRTQVYRLQDREGCDPAVLSGTAEMSFGGLFAKRTVQDLPAKYCAVSRCFRAEISRLQEEKGIYRVHQFNKVEMFSVTGGDESDLELEQFLEIQEYLFSSLGLSYRVLDMPPHELGSPAYRKYDVEAFFPSNKTYGEISSCSNCTDYQSRRLHIRDSEGNFCHTVNGTACAVPRMIMAVCEQFQTPNGIVTVPEALRKHMRGADEIKPPYPKEKRPNLVFHNSPKYFVNKTPVA